MQTGNGAARGVKSVCYFRSNHVPTVYPDLEGKMRQNRQNLYGVLWKEEGRFC